MTDDGFEVGVTDRGFVTLVARKDGDALPYGLDPDDADRLIRELQSARDRAVNQRNGPEAPDP